MKYFHNSIPGNLILVTFMVLFLVVINGCQDKKSSIIENLEQQVHDDSIRKTTEAQITLKLEKKQALQDSINAITQQKKLLNDQLRNAEVEVEVQRDKLSQTREFKWLRSKSEKEKQIRNQMLVIKNLEENILTLRNKLLELDIRLENYNQELVSFQ